MGVRTCHRAAAASVLSLAALFASFPETVSARPGEDPSQAGRTALLAMAEAHGGLNPWRDAPTVSFEDEFAVRGQPPRVSRVTVEQGRRRAYIDFPGTRERLSWDGERAWSEGWKSSVPPRFLALLNYYFLNLPWLAMDPGVHLGEPGKARLWEHPKEYLTVRMTFEEGVGDTPRDYYLLYLDPSTKRLEACEYIVTYRALLPPGVDATPPHVLVYDEWERVNGLMVPMKYTIYSKDHSVYATCRVRDWSFSRPFDETQMQMPAGAVLDTSTP